MFQYYLKMLSKGNIIDEFIYRIDKLDDINTIFTDEYKYKITYIKINIPVDNSIIQDFNKLINLNTLRISYYQINTFIVDSIDTLILTFIDFLVLPDFFLNLTNLKILTLSWGNLEDITNIPPNLYALTVEYCKINQIPHLKHVKEIVLRANQIQSIQSIQNIENLEYLFIGEQINNIDNLLYAVKLEILEYNCYIKNIICPPNLKILNICCYIFNNIINISNKLEYLILHNTTNLITIPDSLKGIILSGSTKTNYICIDNFEITLNKVLNSLLKKLEKSGLNNFEFIIIYDEYMHDGTLPNQFNNCLITKKELLNQINNNYLFNYFNNLNIVNNIFYINKNILISYISTL